MLLVANTSRVPLRTNHAIPEAARLNEDLGSTASIDDSPELSVAMWSYAAVINLRYGPSTVDIS
jgi:hypothetical protein